jgi:pimeloyl-ACP methyl ester carboxylesterase
MRSVFGALGLTVLATGFTAAPKSLRFAEIDLRTGVRMHYAEQGDPAGPALILLHGYSDSWYSFSRILPLLAPKFHVFVLDQRGHGRSAAPDSGYAPADLAEDVLAFMDARNIARATLVGHSMGSFVAQQAAAAAPGRVTRLVLVGSATAPARVAGREELEAAVMALEDPVPEPFIREFQMSTLQREVPAEFLNRVIVESARLTAERWKALLRGMLAMEPATALARAEIPTLVIWGDRDALFTRAHQDELVALMKAERLVVYEGTGHAPHWEEPERFARDLVRFVSP